MYEDSHLESDYEDRNGSDVDESDEEYYEDDSDLEDEDDNPCECGCNDPYDPKLIDTDESYNNRIKEEVEHFERMVGTV